MKYLHRVYLITIVFSLNYFLDRITKIWAINELKGGKDYHFLNDLVVLTYAENRGAFLGAGSDFPVTIKYILFIVLPLIACFIGLLYCIFKEESKLSIIIIISIIAGGIANIQDRIFNDGIVTDFLNFGIGPNFRTGVLNIADMSITFGAIALVIYEIYRSKHEQAHEVEE